MDKVGTSQQTEVVAQAKGSISPAVETEETEVKVEDIQVETPVQKTVEVQENQAEDKVQVEQPSQTEAATQESTPSNPTSQEPQVNINEDQDQPTTVAANEQIYNGTEEPQIVEKSLIAEIFTKLF